MKRAGKLAGILAAVVLAAKRHASTIRAGANQAGDPLELWHCHGYDSRGSAQRWTFSLTPYGPALHGIYSPTLCLGVNGYAAHSGDRLLLVRRTVIASPFWTVLSRNAYPGDSAFELEYGGTGYCMTMPDWSGGNAEPVLLRPCQPGNGLQLWNIG